MLVTSQVCKIEKSVCVCVCVCVSACVFQAYIALERMADKEMKSVAKKKVTSLLYYVHIIILFHRDIPGFEEEL